MGVRKASQIIADDTRKMTRIPLPMSGKRAKLCSDKEAESGADRYVRLLEAPECWKFFLKVMYHLPYDIREDLLAAATREGIKCPKKYFTYSARRELEKLGY